jgi:hypothetical protein
MFIVRLSNGLRVSCVHAGGARKEAAVEATYVKCQRIDATLPYLVPHASFTRGLGGHACAQRGGRTTRYAVSTSR